MKPTSPKAGKPPTAKNPTTPPPPKSKPTPPPKSPPNPNTFPPLHLRTPPSKPPTSSPKTISSDPPLYTRSKFLNNRVTRIKDISYAATQSIKSLKFRPLVKTVCTVATIVSGVWLGMANGINQDRIKEYKKYREAPVEERIELLEGRRGVLVSAREGVEAKIRRLDGTGKEREMPWRLKGR